MRSENTGDCTPNLRRTVRCPVSFRPSNFSGERIFPLNCREQNDLLSHHRRRAWQFLHIAELEDTTEAGISITGNEQGNERYLCPATFIRSILRPLTRRLTNRIDTGAPKPWCLASNTSAYLLSRA
ncbi:hypothetical protein KCP70_05975 [Salmonella enterica subsp. enterica]|nr:hypothetical protein KCP70_05975 [Salmonella enterica subsp. enterica]